MLTIRHLTGPDLSPPIVAKWASVQQRDATCESPFFHPAFAQCVAQINNRLEIAIVERNGEPVAFWPFERRYLLHAIPIGGVLSDYHGVVGARSLSACLDPLDLLRACKLSSWEYSHLPANQLPAASGPRRCAESLQLDLSRGYGAYVAQKRATGTSLFERVAYLERRLAREVGPAHFVMREQSALALEQVIEWKSAQYVRTRQRNIFRSEGRRALLGAIHRRSEEEFSGLLSAIYVGDRLIAAHFGMRSRGVLHYWFPAYDPEFARFSPGLLLLLRMAQGAADLGISKIDLGAGAYPYKVRLATNSVPLSQGSLERATWHRRAKGVRRTVAGLLRKLPFTQVARGFRAPQP